MVISKRVNIKRYQEIITVFAKHGFGLVIDQLGIFEYLKMRKRGTEVESVNSKRSIGERLRISLEELGPTFVKVGQILSTRADIVPHGIVEELKKLQNSVQPFSFNEVKTLIESEFEDVLENIYMEFSQVPIASASISQVHYAVLKNGEKVAVKVQRPGIERIISHDLNILKDLAHFVDNHTKFGKIYDFSSMVNDFERTLKNELDFTKEGENADTFRENFTKDEGIKVPEVKWTYTSRRVLTMEYIEGIGIDDHRALEKAGVDKRETAEKIAASICNQILRDGFFHADPHPGNIKVLPDGTIVFLDLGMVGRVSESRRKTISKFFVGVANKDTRMVARAIMELDAMSEKKNIRKFEQDIDIMIDKYLTLPWSRINIGELLYEVFNIAFLNGIRLPREFTLLAKSLATIQSLLEKLAPELNTLEVAKPIAKKLVIQSYSIKNISKTFKKNIYAYKDLIGELPFYIQNLLEKAEDGDLTVQLRIKDIDRVQKRFDRALNRISFSVILLSVSIIITGIIIGSSQNAVEGSEMYLMNLTALKIGLVVAFSIIIGVVISMLRSDRLK
ncbi:2-polyprenylphenol 6-hydroxylase [Acetivibrio cellulolyticus]|uniref:2-polyprenylphenol 6-hydroxylase n=1 Tax=Acetivibrio cellulolyticus TaxID=35830 RepID=UPI0001E2F658|nr:2-polyprenylphenol 6-hydroxylase [Acetivibrio cellulolyticus]